MNWKLDTDRQSEWGSGNRERMVWELLAKPSVEYAMEVWWTGGRYICRKLESSQMKMSRRLLGHAIQ